MGRRRRQRNITLQKTNNNLTKDLVENEGNEFPVTDTSRMMIKMTNKFNKDLKEVLKEDLKKECKEEIME
jgi:hypothetical protein